ncbi:MAG: uridine kinase [Eggerthellaceae bacterium]|nr:uridine kinase [Eggerthellaceae bacterium]
MAEMQAAQLDARARKPVVVAITGRSGSGKTTFAKRLCDQLGTDAVMLSHDDYYKHLPNMTSEEAAVYDFDSPEALDTHLLVKHLHALKAGESVDVPSYDFAAHTRTEAARRVEPSAVIVLEGLLIMCDPELKSLFDLVVFVDTDPDVSVLRRIERDCKYRGTDLERAINMYLGTAKPAYEKYVEPFKCEAGLVISDASSDAALETVIAACTSCTIGVSVEKNTKSGTLDPDCISSWKAT